MEVVLRKPLFPTQFQSCGCLLWNLVLGEIAAAAISKGHSRKYGLRVCSEGSQAILGIHCAGRVDQSVHPESET